LFLLDTNLPENPSEAREITARLYAAEPKIRLAQEVLLGIGRYLYGGKLPCLISGRYGFTVRVTPRGDGALKNMPGLIAWA
jgi:hypothetical protein